MDNSSNTNIGKLSYSLSNLLRVPEMEILNEKFPLQGSSEDAYIILCLRLKVS